ncbi:MAG: hypothetical protein QHC67_10075 [Sphingobium sp.]|uniref:hypothetical protein n=1 Tax=Sphingobium sp. TaxID=1912891 RepID=UPI0029B2F023|nr:hypothetical protein [Sphingobium sp.]MDX3910152.1 hypothetical protein [Sphingobium sp.]
MIAEQETVIPIFIVNDEAELRVRLQNRSGHFMPASMLDSQLAAMEPPTVSEHAIAVDGMLDVGDQLRMVLGKLGSRRL